MGKPTRAFFQGRRVFITGGSEGTGLSAARQLSSLGASVLIGARRREPLIAALELIRGAALDASAQLLTYVCVDVTDTDSVNAAAAAAPALLGGEVDVLVCNCGTATTGAVEDVPVETFRRLLDVNFLGHVRTVKAFLPQLKSCASRAAATSAAAPPRVSHVMLLSSLLGQFGSFEYGAYSASKCAIEGFAQALRQETLHDNVCVGVFYPPTTVTPGLDRENATKSAVLYDLEAHNTFLKEYSSDRVASDMLNALQRGRFGACVGWESWLVLTLVRYFGALSRVLIDRELADAKRRVQEAQRRKNAAQKLS